MRYDETSFHSPNDQSHRSDENRSIFRRLPLIMLILLQSNKIAITKNRRNRGRGTGATGEMRRDE